MKSSAPAFAFAVALGAAAPAMAQDAESQIVPTTDNVMVVPDIASPASQTTPPKVDLFGMSVTLKGAEGGVAINADNGKLQRFVSPVLEFDTGHPLADFALSTVLSNTAIGNRFVGNTFDDVAINSRIGPVLLNSIPQTDVTAYKTRDDNLFGPRYSISYALTPENAGKPSIGVGLNYKSVGISIVGAQKPGQKTSWSAQAGIGLDGVEAHLDVRRPITPNMNAHAFAGTDGLGARLTYDRNVSSSFRIATQASATTRYGLSAGASATYTKGNTDFSAGLETARGGTMSFTTRTHF